MPNPPVEMLCLPSASMPTGCGHAQPGSPRPGSSRHWLHAPAAAGLDASPWRSPGPAPRALLLARLELCATAFLPRPTRQRQGLASRRWKRWGWARGRAGAKGGIPARW